MVFSFEGMEIICLGPSPDDIFNKKMKFDCSLCDTLKELTLNGLKSHLGAMNGYDMNI